MLKTPRFHSCGIYVNRKTAAKNCVFADHVLEAAKIFEIQKRPSSIEDSLFPANCRAEFSLIDRMFPCVLSFSLFRRGGLVIKQVKQYSG
jgi:hypothetical protein